MKKKDKKNLDREIRSALLEDVEYVTALVTAQWKKIVIGGIIIIIAVGIFYSMSLNAERKERRAGDALAAAVTEQQLCDALKEFPDYAASNNAYLRLARIYTAEKKYDLARQQYRKIAANGASTDMLCRIRLEEAYLLELEGKPKEAAAAFRAAADNAVSTAARIEALYGAGRLMLSQGNKNEAKILLAQAVAAAQNVPENATVFAGLANSLLMSLQN